MTFETLRALADRAALFTALRQDQLAAALHDLGEHRWDVDLAAGRFTFTATASRTEDAFLSTAGTTEHTLLEIGAEEDRSAEATSEEGRTAEPALDGGAGPAAESALDGSAARSACDVRTIEATPHLLASIAPGPRSLRWSWALPHGDPSGVTAVLRAYGEQHGIPELTEGEVAFPDDIGDDVEGWIAEIAQVIAGAAVEIAGRSPYYCAPVAGGTRAVLLLDAPLPALTVADAVAALPRVLPSLALRDPRSSVWDLARLTRWQLSWDDGSFTAATVTDSSGSALFTFDEHARITGIRMASPTP